MLILIISFLIAILDQLTKQGIRSGMALGDSFPVIPGVFNIHYVQNTGAAWGIFAGLNGWLIALSIGMLGFIIFFRRSFMAEHPAHRVAVGLMIAGIVGNLIDRIRLDYVVDFLDFYWKTHHFPTFNVADSAICTGVGLYIVSQWFIQESPAGSSVKPRDV